MCLTLPAYQLGEADGGIRASSPRFVGTIASRQWEFRPCVVTGYDSETQRFVIRFLEDGVTKTVWRIALKFDVEPEWLFDARRSFALVRFA